MSANIILECSKANDVSENPNNNEWENVFQNGVVIENGDAIIMRNAFLSVDEPLTGNIVIAEDIDIKIRFGYYQFNIQDDTVKEFFNDKANPDQPIADGVVGVDGNLYYATNGDVAAELTPYISEIKISLDKGSYSPAYIAEYITNQINTLKYGVNMEDILSEVSQNGENSTNTLCNAMSTCTHGNIAYFRRVGSPNLYYRYPTIDNTLYRYFMGATQFALNYDETSQLFSFTYLHTPIYDSNGAESVGWYPNRDVISDTDLNRGAMIGASSGIFITGTTPTEFWNQLGFTKFNWRFKEDEPFQDDADLNKFLSHLVLGKWDYGMIQNQSSIIDNSALLLDLVDCGTLEAPAPVFFNVSETRPIYADQPYTAFQAQGYYLIQIDTNYKTDFRENENEYSSVVGIVSKQWTNNYILTAFSDSSIDYVHNGAPFVLTSAKVKILNEDKTPASLSNLNTIFLQVIKNQQQVPLPLPAPIENHKNNTNNTNNKNNYWKKKKKKYKQINTN